MFPKAFNSHKSLLSTGLLMLLVGFASTACGESEVALQPTAKSAQTAKPTAALAKASKDSDSKDSDSSVRDRSAAPPNAEPRPRNAAAEPETEVDSADAYDDIYDGALDSTFYKEESGEGADDADLYALPDLIDGMYQGMPYSEARELTIGEIWWPRAYPPVDAEDNPTVAAMQALGYEEALECSSGLCTMEFDERDGSTLSIIVSTAQEELTVWSWGID